MGAAAETNRDPDSGSDSENAIRLNHKKMASSGYQVYILDIQVSVIITLHLYIIHSTRLDIDLHRLVVSGLARGLRAAARGRQTISSRVASLCPGR